MTCYYCIHNIKDRECELEIEGYPLPSDIECRHFEFDTGTDEEDDPNETEWDEERGKYR